MSMKDLFGNIANAKTWETGAYFEPGEYLLRTVSQKINHGHRGVRGIAEFEVVESASTEPGKLAAPVGAKRSAIFVLDGPNKDTGMSKLKGMITAYFTDDAKSVSPSDLQATLTDIFETRVSEQPLRGRLIRLSAYTASKATKQGVFVTNLKFKFVEESATKAA